MCPYNGQRFCPTEFIVQFKTPNSSRRERRLEVETVVGCPTAHGTQGYDHKVIVLSVRAQWCIAALPKDGPWLCTSVCASPKLEEYLEQAMKRWKESCWCCIAPVCSATSSASFFICILLSLWIHMISLKCKTTLSFLWAGVSFCPVFFAQHQAQLGYWLVNRTQKSFS